MSYLKVFVWMCFVSILSLNLGFSQTSFIPLFDSEVSQGLRNQTDLDLRNAVFTKLYISSLNKVIEQSEVAFSSILPLNKIDKPKKISFSKFELLTDDFVVNTDIKNNVEYSKGKYFAAKTDDLGSFGAFSFYENKLMGILSFSNGDSYNVGRFNNIEDEYIILKDSDFEGYFFCDTDDSVDDSIIRNSKQYKIVKRSGKCIDIYLEADYALFLKNGKSVKRTVDYILGLFAETALLYKREGVNIKVSKVKVWETKDNYSVNSSYEALDQFVLNNIESNSDLNLLIAFGADGLGGLAYINALCKKNLHFAYSNINDRYKNVPLYSWSAMVLTHELGHNLGSRHTHSCSWNGNHTQIDDCGNVYLYNSGSTPEGNSCFDSENPIFPNGGGTIMSYCHLVGGVGIDLSKGFGDQPRDVILKRISQANCIDSCESLGNVLPVADFGTKRNFTCEGGSVRFIDKSLNSPVEWFWQMETSNGDDTILYHKSPKLKYDSIGFYNVSLIVSNGVGSDTIVRNDFIEVIEGPKAKFRYEFIEDNKVQFINESELSESYYWSFGDRKISLAKNPKHKYKEGGKYIVELFSTRDTCETEAYFVDTVEVKYPYRARGFYNKTLACLGDTVKFYTLENKYDSVKWNFTGAQIDESKDEKVFVIFENIGYHGFELIAYSKYGNDTLIKEKAVEVIQPVVADFEYEIHEDTIFFINKSINASSFEWNFGDDVESKEENPYVIKNTNFEVELIAKNDCSRSVLVKSIITTRVIDVQGDKLVIYPNPNNGKFVIYLDKSNEKATLLLYNKLGKIIFRKNINKSLVGNSVEIEINEKLIQGTYFVKVLNGRNIYTEKILVLK